MVRLYADAKDFKMFVAHLDQPTTKKRRSRKNKLIKSRIIKDDFDSSYQVFDEEESRLEMEVDKLFRQQTATLASESNKVEEQTVHILKKDTLRCRP